MSQPSKDAFLELCAGAPLELYPAGRVLMSQDDDGGYCLVVLAGDVHIDITTPDGKIRRLATRGAGELIGELSLFHQKRSATVTAASDCQCARISHPALLQMITSQPPLMLAVLAVAMEKAREMH